MKVCNKCKVEKPLDEFHKDSSSKDGKQRKCKSCNISTRRAWVADNYDRSIELTRQWNRKNRERCNENARRWASENLDRRRMIEHRRRARIAAAVPQRWQKSECSEQLCYWCGVDLATVETHVEHLMPISLGGEAKSYNEAPACKDCNLSKSDTHPLVWLARMF